MMRWLDNNIAAPGPDLCLCLSEKEYLNALKSIGMKPIHEWIKTEYADATAHHMETPKGTLAFIICLRIKETTTAMEIAGLLIHEAVHVWQIYAESIGETNPGKEQEAYAIQCVSQSLLQEYASRINA